MPSSNRGGNQGNAGLSNSQRQVNPQLQQKQLKQGGQAQLGGQQNNQRQLNTQLQQKQLQ